MTPVEQENKRAISYQSQLPEQEPQSSAEMAIPCSCSSALAKQTNKQTSQETITLDGGFPSLCEFCRMSGLAQLLSGEARQTTECGVRTLSACLQQHAGSGEKGHPLGGTGVERERSDLWDRTFEKCQHKGAQVFHYCCCGC